jgi:hypothetical protein
VPVSRRVEQHLIPGFPNFYRNRSCAAGLNSGKDPYAPVGSLTVIALPLRLYGTKP